MKKIFSVLLVICLALTLLSACGKTSETPAATSSNEKEEAVTSEKTEKEEQPAEDDKEDSDPEQAEEDSEKSGTEEKAEEETNEHTFNEQGKVLLDNDMVTITLEDEVDSSNYVGYSLVIENKSELYILVSVDNSSVNGVMTYIDLQGSTVAPEKKSKAEMRFYTSDSIVTSFDDLTAIEGTFSISSNNDGSHSYSGNGEVYPFEIQGTVGGNTEIEVNKGQVLLDNDVVTISLSDPFEESYYVGYGLVIENKSDMYILVDVDNGSVDGFMTYLDVNNSSVAPGKMAISQLRVSTSDSGIETIDDFINVEGEFRILSNTDGSHSYSYVGGNQPFVINSADASEDSSAGNVEDSDSNTSENGEAAFDIPVSAESIEAALQGTWSIAGGSFMFENGIVTLNNGPTTLSGTYEVNTTDSVIDATIEATDGSLVIHMPYEYNNGTLIVKNNQGDELTKQ